MELTARLTELEGLVQQNEAQLATLRGQLDQMQREGLLLIGAMLEVRRMLNPEPITGQTAEEVDAAVMRNPGGTDPD